MLYGLMELAQGQQEVVQEAIEGPAAKRAALRREWEQLARLVAGLEQRTGAARGAVLEGLAAAVGEGVAAVQAETRPLLGQMAGMAREAEQAEAALREMVLWAS